MLQQTASHVKRLGIVAIAVLLVAGSARAQQGWPINGSNWGYRGSSAAPPSYSPAYESPAANSTAAAPNYANYGDYAFPATPSGEAVVGSPYYYPGQTVSSYQSFYNAGNMTGDRPVLINVRVPAQAQVWFGDAATQTPGTFRQFESPLLEPGHKYSYVIRARWMENGRSMERSKKVTFQPGEQVNVNFLSSSGGGS